MSLIAGGVKFSLSRPVLIVEAARIAGCSVLLTEDLDDGQVIEGITVENPFS